MAAQPIITNAVRFDVYACSSGADGDVPIGKGDDLSGTGHRRRRYRRTPRSLGPRTYRTRPDPIADVWDEVRAELEGQPERTAKAAFRALQERYPDQFPNVQLRTLQRRVQAWRASVIVAFDDQWLRDDVLADQLVPRPLRVFDIVPWRLRRSSRMGKTYREATNSHRVSFSAEAIRRQS